MMAGAVGLVVCSVQGSAAPTVVTGAVIDEAGTPLPGAHVWAPGLATTIAQRGPGEAGPIELKLGPEAVVHGRVLDEEGQPVAGTDVRRCFASGPPPSTTRPAPRAGSLSDT
jgi:hypothetical protein